MYKDAIIRQLNRVEEVPTMLNIAMEIERLTKDINSSASQISDIIKLDPALTTKVLKVANSVAFAASKEITDLKQVISRLGYQEIRRVAISVAVLNSFQNTFVDYEHFWLHSITTAYIAVNLAKKSKPKANHDRIFIAGILHDVGVLILDQYFSALYKKVFDIAAKRKFDLQLVENKILGLNHAEVAQLLLRKWKISDDITSIIRFHHQPQLAKENIFETRIIYVANFICNNRGIDNGTGFFPEGFYDDIWEELNLSVDDVPEVLEIVEKETQMAREILRLGGR